MTENLILKVTRINWGENKKVFVFYLIIFLLCNNIIIEVLNTAGFDDRFLNYLILFITKHSNVL